MLKTLWGDWADGRLAAKPYLVGLIMTFVALIAIVLGIGIAAGITHAFFGGWVDHFEAGQRQGWAVAGLLGFFAAMLAIGLAQLNLVIKRGRDTGLPGLWVGLAYLAFLAFGGSLVMAIILAFVPSGQFSKEGG